MIAAERPPCDTAAVRVAVETPGCASHARTWVLVVTILGSSVAFTLASIINVALPAIQDALGATVAEMQWVASAYTVLLASLTLAGGAGGDRFGRRRAFMLGLAGLALASVAASVAPDAKSLIVARAVQGLAAALLVPNSLALLGAAFPKAERGRAIGTWSAATALVGAVSPLIGGWFVDAGSWRVAFATIVPLALVTLAIAALRVPDPPVMRRAPPVDWTGAVLATIGLAATVTGIIAFDRSAGPLVALAAGLAALGVFVVHERRTAHPMVPPGLFRSRTFRGVNVLTVLVYAGISGAFFVLPFKLVQVDRYSATATGAAFLPFALLVGLLSRRAGTLADRIGAKPLLVAGAVLTAIGLAAFALPGLDAPFWASVLAPMTITGFGMALTVAPLTTTVLASVDPQSAGIASGINNTAARVGGLLAIAVIGVVALALYRGALERQAAGAGVPATVTTAVIADRHGFADVGIPASIDPALRPQLAAVVNGAFLGAFRGSLLLCALLVLAGAAVAAVTLRVEDVVADAPVDVAPTCDHLGIVGSPAVRSGVCAECVRLGQTWVHLRQCLSCGYVGCCDSSRNRHASAHFWATQHPIVRSAQPGEDWRWCYIDEIAV